MGEMKSAERVSATSYVVDYIRVAIQNGQMKVGDKLPREAEMAEELKVGRSTLREAIKILNAYGVVESRQGEGTFVVNQSAQKFFEFMGFFPGRESDMPYLELRRVVETGNVTMIYDQVDDATLDKLQGFADVMKESHSIDEYVAADIAFHNTMLSYLENPMLVQLNGMLVHMLTDLLSRIFCYPEVVADAYKEHTQIVEALRSRDLEACVKAVKFHLDQTADSVEKLFGENGI